jgi:hypothetical protein
MGWSIERYVVKISNKSDEKGNDNLLVLQLWVTNDAGIVISTNFFNLLSY